jgi:hypothetical protein
LDIEYRGKRQSGTQYVCYNCNDHVDEIFFIPKDVDDLRWSCGNCVAGLLSRTPYESLSELIEASRIKRPPEPETSTSIDSTINDDGDIEVGGTTVRWS